jgi:hypothetical protein
VQLVLAALLEAPRRMRTARGKTPNRVLGTHRRAKARSEHW